MSFRSLFLRLCLGASSAAAVAACNGSSTTAPDATADGSTALDGSIATDAASAMTACADLASATCSRVDTCEPGTGILVGYGTMANCLSVVQQDCLIGLAAPGTAQTPAHEEGCATAIMAQSCDDRRAGVLLDACTPPAGPAATGTPCYAAAQCQSQYCQLPRAGGTYCGTCQDPPALGTSCALFNCGRGQYCSTSLLCAAPIPNAGTCDVNNPCTPGLICVTATAAATSGTCQPLGIAGATCEPHAIGAPSCDPDAGLYCNATHHCAMYTLVAAGTACGSQSAGVAYNECSYGAECEGTAPTRMCVARPMTGQACDTSRNQGCIAPARCIGNVVDGGVMGTCVIPDPTTCH